MMSIGDSYRKITEHVAQIARRCGRDPAEITVVAISKNQPVGAIAAAQAAGCLHFGENRLQEALPKIEQIGHGVSWHLVGALQKNKAGKAVEAFDLIHSVADLPLAKKIAASAHPARLLLQVNISGEASKQGYSMEEWRSAFDELLSLPNISVEGLMTIAPFTQEAEELKSCFSRLRKFRDELREKSGGIHPLHHLSMGMSNDYPFAIEEGATLLRIGTAIFGRR